MTWSNPSSRTRLFSLLLALVTLAVFWPVVHNGFIEYDDDDYIFENPTVRAGLTGSGFAWAFLGTHAVNYHPLTWLSHMLDCQLFGLRPGAHHLVSVLIHGTNAVLLLWLLAALTGKFWRSAFVAALFALNPLRVESVAWAAERKDVLSALFFMLTLLLYVRHVRAQANPARPRIGGELRLALFCFLLALLSKPMVVTLPVILLLLDFWPLKRISAFRVQGPGLLLEKWPFFLLSLIFGVITLLAQHGTLPKQPATLRAHAENMATDLLGYLEKIVWPHDLSFLYLRPEHLSAGRVLVAAAVLAGISILALSNWRQRPWLITGWLWFLVMLLPVTAVALNQLCIADRYTYLPGIGFSLLAVWGGTEAAGGWLDGRIGKTIGVAVAAMILFFCAVQTRQQISYWKTTQTLMEHALRVDPANAVAEHILHIYQFEQEHPGVREKNQHRGAIPEP